jgi:hypothetical protein
VALLLASLGVYGVLAYSVNQRKREIGIRIALGGTSKQIVRLVARQWTRVVGLGLLIGLGCALVATRLSWCSDHSLELLFGLGSATQPLESIVHRPLGTTDRISDLVASRRIVFVEGPREEHTGE